MAKQGKKLFKPQSLAKAARSKSISDAINSEEAPLLPHERVDFSPNPSNCHHVTPSASYAAAPYLRRANSAPSCLQSTPSASTAIPGNSQSIFARGTSKKLQKKQRMDDSKGDYDEAFAAIPAATPNMIIDAQLALGLGPREPMVVTAGYNVPSTPRLRLNAAAAAVPTTTTDDDEYQDDAWQTPLIAEVQHPVHVIYLNSREVIGQGALMPQLKRWLCCNCGRRTHYESPVCSCLDCCHNRCKKNCTILEPA